jgi:hypothetical protein
MYISEDTFMLHIYKTCVARARLLVQNKTDSVTRIFVVFVVEELKETTEK